MLKERQRRRGKERRDKKDNMQNIVKKGGEKRWEKEGEMKEEREQCKKTKDRKT